MFDFKILPNRTAVLFSDDCRYDVVVDCGAHILVSLYVDGHCVGFDTTYYGWDVEEEEPEYDDLSSEDDGSWD